MIELSRTIRCCLDPTRGRSQLDHAGRGWNTFAGWPAVGGLSAYYELEVRCRGEADVETGYLVNISEVDTAVRSHALPILADALAARPQPAVVQVLGDMLQSIRSPLDHLPVSLRWRFTPYHSLTMTVDQPSKVLLRESFEFAAAHRLHCKHLSEDENRAIFGKCNNPGSHGHNYRVEVAAAFGVNRDSQSTDPPVVALERAVHEAVISRFDHMNLDCDVPEFAEINSSVENIARICYERLVDPIQAIGGALRWVTIWETEKTSCTYPAA